MLGKVFGLIGNDFLSPSISTNDCAATERCSDSISSALSDNKTIMTSQHKYLLAGQVQGFRIDNERVWMIHTVSVDNNKLNYVNSFSLGSSADDWRKEFCRNKIKIQKKKNEESGLVDKTSLAPHQLNCILIEHSSHSLNQLQCIYPAAESRLLPLILIDYYLLWQFAINKQILFALLVIVEWI